MHQDKPLPVLHGICRWQNTGFLSGLFCHLGHLPSMLMDSNNGVLVQAVAQRTQTPSSNNTQVTITWPITLNVQQVRLMRSEHVPGICHPSNPKEFLEKHSSNQVQAHVGHYLTQTVHCSPGIPSRLVYLAQSCEFWCVHRQYGQKLNHD